MAILATVAFTSFQNYTSQTRDTKRLSDLSQISKWVEIFQIWAGVAPIPDNPKTLTWGNSTLLVWKINSKVLKSLSNNILDPVSWNEYTYATIWNTTYSTSSLVWSDPTSSTWIISKSLYFSWGYIGVNQINTFSWIDWPWSDVTISSISKINWINEPWTFCYYKDNYNAPILSWYRYELGYSLWRFPTWVTQNWIDRWLNTQTGQKIYSYDNIWHLYTFTKKWNTLNYYIDWKLVSSITRNEPSLPGYPFNWIYIWASRHCSDYNVRPNDKIFTIWIIDEVKFYTKALSDDEVLQQAKVYWF